MKKLFITLLFAGFTSFIPSSLHPFITFTLSAQIPSDGLVAWYPFNGNANDESGNGNNGVVNGATLTADRFGLASKAFVFNGVGNYIEIPSNQLISGLNEISISVWFTFSQNYSLICKSGSTMAGDYRIQGNTSSMSFIFNGVNYTFSGISNFWQINGWNNVMISKIQGVYRLFINGVLMSGLGSTSNFQVDSGTSLKIGSDPWGAQEYHSGKIDDLAIYNRALSSSEIQQIYQDQTGQVAQPCSSNPTIVLSSDVSANAICEGSDITLTATITDGGQNPVIDWLVNGVIVQSGFFETFSFTPMMGDVVTAVMTASSICPGSNSVVSNPIVIYVIPTLTPSISIVSNDIDNLICNGEVLVFTASAINAGVNPTFEWLINGIQVAGQSNETFVATVLNDQDEVSCIVTSSELCAIGTGSASNVINVGVIPSIFETVSATIIEGETYTLGTQSLTTAGTYTEVFTSAAGCDSTVTVTLSVNPGPLTCNITAPTTTLCEGESTLLTVNSSISGTNNVLNNGVNWIQEVSGDCYRLIVGPNGKLFVPRRTDLLRSFDNGVTWNNANWPLGIVRSGSSLWPGATYNIVTNQYLQCALDNGYWISNNEGNSFIQTGPTGFGTGGVEMLTLNNGQVLASMGGFQRGVYKSTSTSNSSWSNKYSGVDSYDFTSFNDAIIFSATSNNLLKSTNQGESWTSLVNGNFTDVERIQDSLVWISNLGNLYVAYKDQVSSNIPTRYNFGSGYFDMRYDSINNVLAVVKNTTGVYISFNNGNSWLSYSVPGVTDYYDLCFYEGKLYVGTDIGLYSTSINNSGFLWSTNAATPTITVTPTTSTSYSCTVTQGNSTCTASVDITVNPNVTNAISASIIEGEIYTFGAQSLTTAGTYTEVFTSAAGCDSTVTLTLAVEPLLTCNITAPTTTLCEGESVTLSVNTTGGTGTTSQLPTNLQQGLVAYYPFNGNANDESGNGNHLSVNQASMTVDRFNNLNSSFYLSGQGSRLSNNNNSLRQLVDGNLPFSLSMWLNKDFTANTGGAASLQARVIFAFDGNNVSPYKRVWLTTGETSLGQTQFQFARNNYQTMSSAPEVVYSTGAPIVQGDWHHVCAVYNGQTISVFIDGNELSTIVSGDENMPQSMGGPDNYITGFTLGDNNQNNLVNFKGAIDEVTIHNRPLSLSEIQQLYTAQSYAWSNNATTPTITVTPSQNTTYSCTVTQGNQTCTASVDINVNPLLTWYADADADGFGNPDDVVQDCNQPQGYIANNTDCNDEDAATYPGAAEICDNNRDENCDGADSLCFVAILGCTDVNACNFNPEANTDDNSCILPQPETCNGLDDNCNGQVDEGFTIPSINATSATPALYPTCTGNALKSANLSTGTDSPVIAGNGPDLWYSFTAQYNTLRVGLSAAFGDNSIGLYTNNNGCLELITEEHEVYTASTTATGNQILLTDQLTVGQTYYVAVHQIAGPANASAKVCFTYLNESSCDHYYSNNTGIYTNVCNSFKAQYRANATNYIFNVLSGTQNGVNMNLTPWTYTNNNSNSVVARLGSILPANQSGVNRVYTLSVPTVYGLTDAAGNVSSLVANATSTCTVTLNSELTIALRQADRCPTNKSLTSTIAPDRTVCGAMRYDWEFTEVLPNPGTAQVVQGGNYTTVFFLSNVPGITAGKTYSVRVRPVHSSNTAGQWGSVQCLRVGSAGMMNHPGAADADPPFLRAGGEMNASISIYPNPTSTGSFVLQYNEQEIGNEETSDEERRELVMLDITGKVVFKTNVVLNGNIAEIHFGDLESGLYLVDFGGERMRVQVMK